MDKGGRVRLPTGETPIFRIAAEIAALAPRATANFRARLERIFRSGRQRCGNLRASARQLKEIEYTMARNLSLSLSLPLSAL